MMDSLDEAIAAGAKAAIESLDRIIPEGWHAGDPIPSRPLTALGYEIGTSADQIHHSVRMRWDLSGPIPSPRPRMITCCGETAFYPQRVEFFEWPPEQQHRVYGRCNVRMKCCRCSKVQDHGVALREVDYERMKGNAGSTLDMLKLDCPCQTDGPDVYDGCTLCGRRSL